MYNILQSDITKIIYRKLKRKKEKKENGAGGRGWGEGNKVGNKIRFS